MVPGRPWAHACPFPFRNDAIIYCCSHAVDGHVFLLSDTGASSVSRECSDVILAGCTTQEGAGASALTEQGGSEGKRAKGDSSNGIGERKREKIQHPRKAAKRIKTQADIRHAFFDSAHGSRVRLSAASLTNPFQALILRHEVDHDPMPTDACDGSSELSRYDIATTNSSALPPRDLPPFQLKANLPLQQVDQMQTDERSQHSEELSVDKDILRPRVRAPSPWHSTLVPRHESNTRASGLRHDVFNRINPLKLDHQAISPGSSALQSRNAPNPRKGVSRARPSNGDPSTRHCAGISRLALRPRRSVLRSLQRVSSLQAGSFSQSWQHRLQRWYE